MATIKIACPNCRATGLYAGFAEPKGTAVICLSCDGKGWTMFKYEEFTGRKRKDGIYTIKRSAGTLLVTGVGPTGRGMTYDEFLRNVSEK
jgi:hypothetical protein